MTFFGHNRITDKLSHHKEELNDPVFRSTALNTSPTISVEMMRKKTTYINILHTSNLPFIPFLTKALQLKSVENH